MKRSLLYDYVSWIILIGVDLQSLLLKHHFRVVIASQSLNATLCMLCLLVFQTTYANILVYHHDRIYQQAIATCVIPKHTFALLSRGTLPSCLRLANNRMLPTILSSLKVFFFVLVFLFEIFILLFNVVVVTTSVPQAVSKSIFTFMIV